MLGAGRLLALGLVVGTLAACQTDGLVGPEADASVAKPRVIDTRKTAVRKDVSRDVSKKEAGKPAVAAAPVEAPAQGDGGPATTGSINAAGEAKPAERIVLANAEPAASAESDANAIPAQSLFGNWTLGESNGNRKCRLVLGGVLIGNAYSARSEADCPAALTSVQSWQIKGDELVLRNQSRGVVGRLQPTGPFRFDGQAGGAAVYLMR